MTIYSRYIQKDIPSAVDKNRTFFFSELEKKAARLGYPIKFITHYTNKNGDIVVSPNLIGETYYYEGMRTCPKYMYYKIDFKDGFYEDATHFLGSCVVFNYFGY